MTVWKFIDFDIKLSSYDFIFISPIPIANFKIAEDEEKKKKIPTTINFTQKEVRESERESDSIPC